MADTCRCCSLVKSTLYAVKVAWKDHPYIIIYVCTDCAKHAYNTVEGPDPVTALDMLPLCPIVMSRIREEEEDLPDLVSDSYSSDYEDIPLTQALSFGEDTPDPFADTEDREIEIKMEENTGVSWIYDINYF